VQGRASAIIGGERSIGEDSLTENAVVSFFNGPSGESLACSGTLVTDRHILTAAHCVIRSTSFLAWWSDGEPFVVAEPSDFRVYVGPERFPALCNLSVQRVSVHPGVMPRFDDGIIEDDVAVLELAESAVSSCDRVAPVGFRSVPLDEDSVGMHVEVAGFGFRDAERTLDGRRDFLAGDVAAVEPHPEPIVVTFGGTPERWVSAGDSGGPVFEHDVDGRLRVAGINSTAPRYGVLMATDVGAERGFVESVLGPAHGACPDDRPSWAACRTDRLVTCESGRYSVTPCDGGCMVDGDVAACARPDAGVAVADAAPLAPGPRGSGAGCTASGGAPGAAGIAVVMLALTARRRRSRDRWSRRRTWRNSPECRR
jgi:uncharacterized protein (TIGR03382 family)